MMVMTMTAVVEMIVEDLKSDDGDDGDDDDGGGGDHCRRPMI